jgi:hypothetical protein
MKQPDPSVQARLISRDGKVPADAAIEEMAVIAVKRIAGYVTSGRYRHDARRQAAPQDWPQRNG